MEVKETAACGISQREFAIEFDAEELPDIYRIFLYAQEGIGTYDEDFLDDLKSQMSYIIGPSLDEEPSGEGEEEGVHWEEEGSSFNLAFNETEARKLHQILLAVEHPGEGFDKALNQKLLEQMMEMAPAVLQNLS
jgi:hypothetical protein